TAWVLDSNRGLRPRSASSNFCSAADSQSVSGIMARTEATATKIGQARSVATGMPHRLILLKLLHRLQLPLTILAVCLAPGAASASTSVQCARTLDEELPPDRGIVDLSDYLASQGHRSSADVSTNFEIFNAEPSGTERYFKVHRSSGLVSTARRLDRDRLCQEVPGACCDRTKRCRITLQIKSDKEFTYIVGLAIDINDINDNAPRWNFLEVMREFSEAAAHGESLGLPLAEDADSLRFGVQRYEILPPKPPEFELEFSGQDASSSFSSDSAAPQSLRLVLKRPLDRESRASYQFTLAAYDGGSPPLNGTVRVRVKVADENDESPVFEKLEYSQNVREDMRVGSEILQVAATDRDEGLNAKLKYSISSFSPRRIQELFAVDSATGVLRLRGRLDYEQAKEHQFTVVAKDQSPVASRQGETKIVIRVKDVNDERPSVTVVSDSPRVTENLSTKPTVTVVTVTDQDSGDNGRVNCSLSSGTDMFSLELISGPHPSDGAQALWMYKLVTIRALDREADGIYSRPVTVVIRCADHGRPANTVSRTVHIEVEDVNDHAPEFDTSHFRFNVNERSRVGSEVFALRAKDKDYGANARLTYRLNGTDAFEVSADGRVSLRQRLDREAQPELQFSALAVDHGEPTLTGSALVTVYVKDDNDHHPVIQGYFAFRVPENASIGHLIGKLNATDADEGPNARLHYRLATPPHLGPPGPRLPFRVHSDGRILVSDRLDRETSPRYEFAAVVSDSPLHPTPARSATTTVLINLDDVNDCRPQFLFPSPGNRTLVVPTGAPLSAQLGRLVAVDPDADGNGRLFFFIRAASASSTPPYESSAGPFHIDPDSGIVSLVQPLTQEIIARPPVLTVTVRDGGHPPLESSQTLRIVFRQSSRRPGGDLMDDGGFNAGSLSGSGGGGDGSEDGGRVVVSGDGTDSMVLIAGSLIAVTVIFVLLLLVAFALLSCRRHGRGSSAGQNRRLAGAPGGVCGGSGGGGPVGETFLQRGGVGAGGGGGSGSGVCFTEEESGRPMAVSATLSGSRGFYQDSLAVQRQQQTRRAVGGQQPALEHSASSSLAQAEEEGHSRSSCEEAGGVAGNTSLPRKKQPPNPTGNNYESLLLLRGRKAADGAEISGTGDAHGLEYHRLHYSTVPHQQQHQAAQDPARRSQKPTPPPLLAASYV
ncbi:hypothetical protein BOX15_Mlig021935g4, partial [Macrostomum lignano]